MKVVFDTNTVVSALLFENGSLAWLRSFWCRADVQIPVCCNTVQELLRVLSYPKFGLTKEDAEALLEDYLPFTKTVKVTGITGTPTCRDKHDQMFIDLATLTNTDVLVSGDGDLLEMHDQCNFYIETPREFYQRVQQG